MIMSDMIQAATTLNNLRETLVKQIDETLAGLGEEAQGYVDMTSAYEAIDDDLKSAIQSMAEDAEFPAE